MLIIILDFTSNCTLSLILLTLEKIVIPSHNNNKCKRINKLIEEKEVVTKIRNIRIQKEYSQEYIGVRLGIGQVVYHKLENGKTKLKIEILIKLAIILKVEISCFLE